MNSGEHVEAEEEAGAVREDMSSLKEALQKEREKVEEYLNRLKYLQADFQNYQKRVQKEIGEASRLASEKLMVELLSVLDDLERAVGVGKKAEDKKLMLAGLEMVLKEFTDILKRQGLNPIEALGKPFNPALHEAVSQVETDEYEDDTITQELRKGYIFNNKVIRPSMVQVAKAKKPSETPIQEIEDVEGEI
ncbi:MAG: nucleotide exchange factor GrpE [Candidatus Bathyarchaeia archaeon]